MEAPEEPKLTWYGVDVSKLPTEELVAVLKYLAGMIHAKTELSRAYLRPKPVPLFEHPAQRLAAAAFAAEDDGAPDEMPNYRTIAK